MRSPAPTRPVSVMELQRAWRAVQAGAFRSRSEPSPTATDLDLDLGAGQVWSTPEPSLVVAGTSGGVGASTVALAIATAASPARVIEAAPAPVSGLAGAATAELGVTDAGWSLGRREGVWIARTRGPITGPAQVPLPDEPPAPVTVSVLDAGWGIWLLSATRSWMGTHLTRAAGLVLVTRATIPDLARLELALTLLDAPHAAAAIVGPPLRAWPKDLTRAAGPGVTALLETDRAIHVPLDKHLALHGLDTAALPASLIDAGHRLHTAALAATPAPMKGHP